jgi:ankyrin repeat protein
MLFLIFLCTFVQSLSADRSVSKSYGPPSFFLQDPNDGLCLAGSTYQRCGLETLWYISGKPGTYQIHHRLIDDDDDEKCLDKAQCHLDESEVTLSNCNHCGAKKWNILGDATSGYVLTENKNKYCLKRNTNVIPNTASMVKCDKSFSNFALTFVTKEDITRMSSDGAKLIVAASENSLDLVKEYLYTKKVDINARDWDNMTALMGASRSGHLEMVQFLVREGADHSLQDKDNVTALMEAARTGHLEIVTYLHSTKKADLDSLAGSGVSSLWLAASEGHSSVVSYLLSQGCDANNERTDGVTALMAASAGGHVEIVEALLKTSSSSGAQVTVNNKDKEGITALISACENGSLPLIKLLLDAQAEVNTMSDNGFTPLIIASAHGHTEIVRLLLEFGAEMELEHPEGVTPLMYAAAGGFAETVSLLLEKDSHAQTNINKKHKQGGTALMEAVTIGSSSVVELLLKHGADAFVVDNEGVTSLMSAASQGHTEICRLLIGKGLSVNTVAKSGGTALMFAASGGHSNTTQLLLESGADVNIVVQATPEYIETVAKAIAEGKEEVEPHKDGVTALMLAAQNGHYSVVELLLSQSPVPVEVLAQDEEGMSALIYAMKGSHLEIAILLLKNGADPNDSYPDEKNPKKLHNLLFDAVVASNLDLSLTLIEQGANISYSDPDDGVTILIQAAYLGLESVVQSLLLYPEEIDITASNHEGVDALIAASSEGHVAIVEMLLQSGLIDVNSKDKDGTNALMAAAARGHKKVMERLIAAGANINQQNVDGHSALMFAYNGKNQVATLLDKYSDYVKELMNDTSTKLIQEALQTHKEVVEMLIGNGADESLKDNEGHLAIDFDYKTAVAVAPGVDDETDLKRKESVLSSGGSSSRSRNEDYEEVNEL